MAKSKKVLLKQRKAHSIGFRLGRHLIVPGPVKEYELNEKELKELKGDGPQAWLKVVTKAELEAMPKSNSQNQKMQEAKNKLKDLGFDDTSELSLSDMEKLIEEAELKAGLIEILEEKGESPTGEESIQELEELLQM